MKRNYTITKQMQVNSFIAKYVNKPDLSLFWQEAKKWDNNVSHLSFYQIGVMNIWLDQAEGK